MSMSIGRAFAQEDGVFSMGECSMMLFGRLPDNRWRVTVTTQLDDPRVTSEAPTLAQIEPSIREHPNTRPQRSFENYTFAVALIDCPHVDHPCTVYTLRFDHLP
jgi:hypothetical protein